MPRQTLLCNFRQGVTKRFKKRYISFNQTVSNSTPTEIQKLVIAETSTIVAAKIDLLVLALSAAQSDVQEVRFFLYCRPSRSSFLPDPTQAEAEAPYEENSTDTINGFYVGSVFVSGQETTETRREVGMPRISEKFRFRRKCDRNDSVVLSAESIVRNGAAQSVAVSGAFYLTIQTK